MGFDLNSRRRAERILLQATRRNAGSYLMIYRLHEGIFPSQPANVSISRHEVENNNN